MSLRKKLILLVTGFLLLVGILNLRWVIYLGHLAKHQVKVIFLKERITDRLQKPGLEPTERKSLQNTLAIRQFIEKLYGLTRSKSYTNYYALDRKELGFNITIAPALSLKPNSFHFFPIGSFDYLGFFDKAYAEDWAERYHKKGMDVYLAEIGGYSTLGWFDDPLYSSQLGWGENGLARLIAHEIAHEKLYFNDDTAFSELLASFIEEKAARDYLRMIGRPLPGTAEIRRHNERREEMTNLILTTRKKLEGLYASGSPVAEKLSRKNEIISELSESLVRRKKYFRLKQIPVLNNASLAQFHRYTPKSQAFENLLAQCHKENSGSAYRCWFRELEKLKVCTAAERKKWLEGDGVVEANACQKGV